MNTPLSPCLYSNDSGSLQVFTADDGRVLVKKYQCTRPRDWEVLLKSALVQASDPCPLWTKLREVVIEKKRDFGFVVNLISEVLYRNLPETRIRQDDREIVAKSASREYLPTRSIYSNNDKHVKVFFAFGTATGTQVVIKRFEPLTSVTEANEIVKEALLQARAKSKYSTGIMDICARENGSVFSIDLIIERMNRALQQDIVEKKAFSESDVLLFLYQLGSALLHAKRQGIAHRDIKPANILVSSEGLYKLADFGGAWITHTKRRSPLLFPRTTTNEISGTLQYMSPEMRKAHLDNTIRLDSFACDMYSLGVTAVVMAGIPLEKFNNAQREVLEATAKEAVHCLSYSKPLKQTIRKMLCYDDTQRMEVEELLETVVDQLQLFFPCDNVFKYAYVELIAKERELARKITNLEAKMFPISEELWEGTGEGNLSEIASIWENYMRSQASVFASSFQFLRHVPRPAESSQSIQFSGQLLSIAYDYRHLGWNSISMANIEDSVSFLLRSALLRHDLCPSCQSAGEFLELSLQIMLLPNGSFPAEPLMKTLHFLQTLDPENSLERARVNYNLAVVYIMLGNAEEALEYCMKCLFIKQRLLQENHLDLANSYMQLGKVHLMKYRLQEAENCYKKALEIYLHSVPEYRMEYLSVYSALIELYRVLGKSEDAMFYLRKSLQISNKMLPENHPINITLLYELSSLCIKTGQYEQAKEYCKTSLSIAHQLRNHSFFHIMPLLGFADLHLISGKFSEVLEFCEKALQLSEQSGSRQEPTLMEVYFKMTFAYCGLGKMAEAAECCQKCKELLQDLESPYARLFKLAKLSKMCLLIGRLSEAAECCDESIRIYRTCDSAASDVIIPSLDILATVYAQIGKPVEAFELFSEALRKTHHENPDYTASRYCMLALCCCSLGNLEGALEHSMRAYQLVEQSTNYVCLVTCLLFLSVSYASVGNASDGARYSAKAVEIIEQFYPEKNQITALCYMICGQCKGEMGYFSEASELLSKSLDCIQQSGCENNPGMLLYLQLQAVLCNKKGNYTEAAECSLKALRILRSLYPVDDESTAFMMCIAAINLTTAGKLREAKQYATESLRLGRRFCMGKSVLVAASLFALGDVCRSAGEFTEAVAHFREVISDYRSVLTDEHPIIAHC